MPSLWLTPRQGASLESLFPFYRHLFRKDTTPSGTQVGVWQRTLCRHTEDWRTTHGKFFSTHNVSPWKWKQNASLCAALRSGWTERVCDRYFTRQNRVTSILVRRLSFAQVRFDHSHSANMALPLFTVWTKHCNDEAAIKVQRNTSPNGMKIFTKQGTRKRKPLPKNLPFTIRKKWHKQLQDKIASTQVTQMLCKTSANIEVHFFCASRMAISNNINRFSYNILSVCSFYVLTWIKLFKNFFRTRKF